MESKFTGKLLGLIGIGLLGILIIIFTLGIGTPWAICLYHSWYTKHSTIDGRRLTFDGKGIQLFGRLLLWTLLTIITFGIFSLWIGIKYAQWVTKHTHMEKLPISDLPAAPIYNASYPSASVRAEAKKMSRSAFAKELRRIYKRNI